MVDHLLPSFSCAAKMMRSSAAENASCRSAGLSWLHQRRRQLLLVRSGMPCAMNDQFLAPCACTSRQSRASSCVKRVLSHVSDWCTRQKPRNGPTHGPRGGGKRPDACTSVLAGVRKDVRCDRRRRNSIRARGRGPRSETTPRRRRLITKQRTRVGQIAADPGPRALGSGRTGIARTHLRFPHRLDELRRLCDWRGVGGIARLRGRLGRRRSSRPGAAVAHSACRTIKLPAHLRIPVRLSRHAAQRV